MDVDSTTVLFGINTINAVCSLIATVIQYARWTKRRVTFYRLTWYAHSMIFWWVLLAARSFLGYGIPTFWITAWASGIFLHAFLAAIAHYAMSRQMGDDLSSSELKPPFPSS